MDEEPEPPERALAFEPGDEVVGQSDALEGGAEHELAGMEDERLVAGDLDQLGELRLLLARVDHRGAVVAEDAEAVAEVQVDARRLDRIGQVRLDDDPAGVDLGPDVAVGQDHVAPILAPTRALPDQPIDLALQRLDVVVGVIDRCEPDVGQLVELAERIGGQAADLGGGHLRVAAAAQGRLDLVHRGLDPVERHRPLLERLQQAGAQLLAVELLRGCRRA